MGGTPGPGRISPGRVSAALAAGGLLWGAALCAGFGSMWIYATTPGPAANPPHLWPNDSLLERTPGQPTLVMLAHPLCSCTRASLTELDVVMTQLREPVSAYVLIVQPTDAPEGWSDSAMAHHAMAGVRTVIDRDGAEASRFHASTSGQTIAYDAEGRLLFSGGITAARGHEGSNAGSRRLLAVLDGTGADGAESAVFGCALLDPDPTASAEPNPGGS